MSEDVLKDELSEIAELEKQPAQEQQAPEPKATEQPEPAPQETEHEETVEVSGNKGRYVRYGALHAEREERKKAEARAKEFEARYAQEAAQRAADLQKVNERLAILAQNRAEPREPESQIPDVNTDPIGHFQAKDALREKELADVRKWRDEQKQQAEQSTTLDRVRSEVTRLETEYAASTPDYPAAQEHLKAAWDREAQILGHAPEQVRNFYAMQIVRRAATTGENPGKIAYEYAQARGYAKAQPAAQTQATGPNLDMIARGQATARPTSGGPARATPGELTAEALLAMDGDQFMAKFGDRDSREWDKEIRRFMGIPA